MAATSSPAPPALEHLHDPDELALRVEEVADCIAEVAKRDQTAQFAQPLEGCVNVLEVVWSALRALALLLNAGRVEAVGRQEENVREAVSRAGDAVASLRASGARTQQTMDEQLAALDGLEGVADQRQTAQRVRLAAGSVRQAATEMKGELELSEGQLSRSGELLEDAGRGISEARDQALREGLPGVMSRTTFEQRMDDLLGQAGRSRSTWCVGLVEVDHLDEIDHSHGHLAADALFFRVAGIVQDKCETHPRAIVGFYGKQELGLILPGCTFSKGQQIGKEIAAAVRRTKWQCRGGKESSIISATVSIGITQPRRGERVDDLRQRIEQHLRRARQGGGDAVVAER
ncbi:MAG: GGDEF domain-containing protein [Candidatus Brocadiia bacterium]